MNLYTKIKNLTNLDWLTSTDQLDHDNRGICSKYEQTHKHLNIDSDRPNEHLRGLYHSRLSGHTVGICSPGVPVLSRICSGVARAHLSNCDALTYTTSHCCCTAFHLRRRSRRGDYWCGAPKG